MKVNELYKLKPFCTIDGIDYYDANPNYACADWKLLSSEMQKRFTFVVGKWIKVSKCGRVLSIKKKKEKNSGIGISSNGDPFHYLKLSYHSGRVNLSAKISPNGKKYQFVTHRLIVCTFRYTNQFGQAHHYPEKSSYKNLSGVDYNDISCLTHKGYNDHLLETAKQNSKENKINRGSLDPQKDKSYDEKFSALNALIKKEKDFLIKIKISDLTEEQNRLLQEQILQELNSLNQ